MPDLDTRAKKNERAYFHSISRRCRQDRGQQLKNNRLVQQLEGLELGNRKIEHAEKGNVGLLPDKMLINGVVQVLQKQLPNHLKILLQDGLLSLLRFQS